LSKKPASSPPAGSEEKQPNLPATIKEEIDREIGSLVPQGQRTERIMRLARVMTSELFAGPIAHPRHLREYEAILPGSAERIVSMAEKAQSHNQAMESAIVKGSIRTSHYSMYLGFAALVLLILTAVYAGMHGNNVLAGLLLGTGVLGGAATLIRGRANNGNGNSAGKPEKG
jgi:uncharacterized membrane protein